MNEYKFFAMQVHKVAMETLKKMYPETHTQAHYWTIRFIQRLRLELQKEAEIFTNIEQCVIGFPQEIVDALAEDQKKLDALMGIETKAEETKD